MDLGLKGKVALVTAASRGLGKAVATQLAAEGADLIICSRVPEQVGKLAEQLSDQYGVNVLGLTADVSKKEDILQLFIKAKEFYNKIDILVCNAGGPPSAPFTELTDDDWELSFQTNLMSVVRLVRGAIPFMKENNWGRIVAIASTSVKQPIPGLILSNTMRTGVAGLMKTLSTELAPSGILLNTVCPGRIATDRIQELDEGKAKREGRTIEDVHTSFISKIPVGRYGQPEEFANVVSFLVSEANSYVTGTVQLVDGGATESI